MTRAAVLSSLVGQPWVWRSRNCWHLAVHIERELFGRELSHVSVPADLSKRWVLEAISTHPERDQWQEVAPAPGGVVTAADGDLVLMAHLKVPAHIGVWLKPEQAVIHCDEGHGVCIETLLALKQMGWRNMTFYEPR